MGYNPVSIPLTGNASLNTRRIKIMRCRSCDVNLNDFESTRKSAITGDYYDLCSNCFDSIKDQVIPIPIPEEDSCEIESDDNSED